MLLAIRRYVGALKHYLGELPIHFEKKGGEYPSLPLRLYEQLILLLNNAVTASDYYYLALYRKSITWPDKRKYIGHYMLGRTYSCINSVEHRIVTKDKKIFHLLCMVHQLPVLEIIASYAPVKECLPWFCASGLSELEVILKQKNIENFFLKPTSEQRGVGALALGKRIDDESWIGRPSGIRITLEDVLDHINSHKAKSWIVQRLALPHFFTSEIVENVVCTVRVVTVNDGTPQILGAVMRFGYGDSPADNFEGGGVVALIDLKSGVLGRTLHAENGIAVFGTAHPRTGVQITGKVVPEWSKILEIAKDGSRKFPYLYCIGWDVAVTNEGPVILEANDRSGFPSLQILAGKGLLDGPLGEHLMNYRGIEKSGINVPRAGSS